MLLVKTRSYILEFSDIKSINFIGQGFYITSKMLLKKPISHIGEPEFKLHLCFKLKLPAKSHLETQQITVPALGSQASRQETLTMFMLLASV